MIYKPDDKLLTEEFSLQRSVSLSKPLSHLVKMLLPFAVTLLLSLPKLFKLSPSLEDLPGVGDVGGESQFISKSKDDGGAEDINGRDCCFVIVIEGGAKGAGALNDLIFGGGGLGGAFFLFPSAVTD